MIRQSLQTKLLYTFGLILVIAAGNSVYFWITAGGIRTNVSREMTQSVTLLDRAQQITARPANRRSGMRGVSLFSTVDKAEQALKARASFEATAAICGKWFSSWRGTPRIPRIGKPFGPSERRSIVGWRISRISPASALPDMQRRRLRQP